MKELENYVKTILKIPYCNFDGINPKIAYEIIVGLSLMYEMYPFFNRVICSIENIDEYINHVNLLSFSDRNNMESMMPTPYHSFDSDDPNTIYGFAFYSDTNDLNEYKLPIVINRNFADYCSLIIFKNVKQVDVSKIKDLSKTNYGRFGIYHEFGHLLNFFLHISSSDKLKEIIKGHNIVEEISDYATTNNSELVAEAFASYIFSKRKLTKLEKILGKTQFCKTDYKVTPLVEKIGNLIDDEYEKFTRFRQIKFINKRYNFNKRFTIKKNLISTDVEKIEKNLKKL